MNINLQKTVTAGVAGTIAFTLVMFLGPMMGLPKMDMGSMLGTMNPIMPLPYLVGWMMHFIIGVVLTAIYASFFLKILPSEGWKKGIIYSIIPFMIAQVMLMPMMGMGLFSGGNLLMLTGSLFTHLAYGAVAGAVYGEG